MREVSSKTPILKHFRELAILIFQCCLAQVVLQKIFYFPILSFISESWREITLLESCNYFIGLTQSPFAILNSKCTMVDVFRQEFSPKTKNS